MPCCFFSISLRLGAKRVSRSCNAFWPSLVPAIADCMLIIATLVGVVCAAARPASCTATSGTRIKRIFRDSFKVVPLYRYHSERAADRKAEGAVLLEEWRRLSDDRKRAGE